MNSESELPITDHDVASSEKRRVGSSPASSKYTSPSIMPSPPRRFSSPTKKSALYSDRFIPNRASSHLDDAFDLMEQVDPTSKRNNRHEKEETKVQQTILNSLIRSEILGHSISSDPGYLANKQKSKVISPSPNVLKYNSSSDVGISARSSYGSTSPKSSFNLIARSSASGRMSYTDTKKVKRKINRIPYKVLDAPSLQDDFYLNLIDWSSSNILAVGLGSNVYLWSAYTSRVSKLNDFNAHTSRADGENSNSETITVTSVAWMNGATHLSIGLSNGNIEVWDTGKCQLVRKLAPHAGRVSALAWNQTSSLLASGSRDRQILLQDVRIRGMYDDFHNVSQFSGPVFTSNNQYGIPSTGAVYTGTGALWSSPHRASHGVNDIYSSISTLYALSPHEVLRRAQAAMPLKPYPSSSYPSRPGASKSTSLFESSFPNHINAADDKDTMYVGDIAMPPDISGSYESKLTDSIRAHHSIKIPPQYRSVLNPCSDGGEVSIAGDGTGDDQDFVKLRPPEIARSLWDDDSSVDSCGEDDEGDMNYNRDHDVNMALSTEEISGQASNDIANTDITFEELQSNDISFDDSFEETQFTLNRHLDAQSTTIDSSRSAASTSTGVGRTPPRSDASRSIGGSSMSVPRPSSSHSTLHRSYLQHQTPDVASRNVNKGSSVHLSGGSYRTGLGRFLALGSTSVGDRDIDRNMAPSVVRHLNAHKQEVCGLKWSFDDKQLASGGNDNKLYIWNIHGLSQTADTSNDSRRLPRNPNDPIMPEYRFDEHLAAVKAIAWSPHQHGLLASGGGTADKTIRFWNTITGTPLHHVDTGSQVCNLMWSTHINELVSTHGYSLNQICVWKYPSMQKIATLTGHTLRVLYLAMSPDGQSIVTGAGDETLRFWNVFPGSRLPLGQKLGSTTLLPSGGDIR